MGINNEWEMTQRMMFGDFNPNHDPSDGRFTSGGSGGTYSSGDVIKTFTKKGDEYFITTELKSVKVGAEPERYSKELWEEELAEAKKSWKKESDDNEERRPPENGADIAYKQNLMSTLRVSPNDKTVTEKGAEYAKEYLNSIKHDVLTEKEISTAIRLAGYRGNSVPAEIKGIRGTSNAVEIKGFNQALSNAEAQHKEQLAVSKARSTSIKARTAELVKAGVDKELAKVMATAEYDSGVIKPVVY